MSPYLPLGLTTVERTRDGAVKHCVMSMEQQVQMEKQSALADALQQTTFYLERAKMIFEAQEEAAEAVGREEKTGRITADVSRRAEEKVLHMRNDDDHQRAEVELLAAHDCNEGAEQQLAHSKELLEAEQSGRALLQQALRESQALVQQQEVALLAAREQVRGAQAQAREQLQARLTAEAVHKSELAGGKKQIEEQRAHIEELQAMLKTAAARAGALEAAAVVDKVLKSGQDSNTPALPLNNRFTSSDPQGNELSVSPEQLHSPSSASPARVRPSRFALMKKAQFYASRQAASCVN